MEATSKESLQKWLHKLQQFMKYLMLLAETMIHSKSDATYLKDNAKFANVITFGFAFLFN